MLSLGNSLEHLRKILRDPDGAIWSDAVLLNYWKRALIEVAQTTGATVAAEVRKYPQEYTWTVFFEWERQFTEGDAWTPLANWEAGEAAICYAWEASYAGDSDEYVTGYAVTHPWESAYAEPYQLMPVKVGGRHLKTIYAAYDESTIDLITQQALGRLDQFYRTREGKTTHWYWWDTTDMTIGLYPRPAPVLDDLEVGEYFDDDGGIVIFEDGKYETSDTGLVDDSLETADNLFLVYQRYDSPTTMWDEADYPKWLRHYIEACVLEYAYSADTDGFVPSLRDYWTMRKKAGFEIVKRLKSVGMRDRIIQRGGSARRGVRVEPLLPSNYDDRGSR